MMIEVSSEQSRSHFNMHTECCDCCCCVLLPFVIVCWMAEFVAGSLSLIPVFSFSSFIRDLFLMYPLAALVSHLRPRFGVSPPRRTPPCNTMGKLLSSQRFSSPNPIGRGGPLARPRSIGGRGARGGSCPSGERRGPAAREEDKASPPNQKSVHTSTTPTTRRRNRGSPGVIPPRKV